MATSVYRTYVRSLAGVLAAAIALAPLAIRAAQAPPVAIDRLTITQGGAQNGVWQHCVVFKNTGDRPISTVRFGFLFYDAFGAVIDRFNGDASGTFSPGIVIDQNDCWMIDVGTLAVGHIDIAVLAIRYEDGSTWTNPEPRTQYRQQYVGHPDSISCGWLLHYSWVAAQRLPACQTAIEQWYVSHASVDPDP